MFWKIRSNVSALGIYLILGLLALADAAYPEPWDRHPAEREGGVINDFAYNPDNGMLCAVAMENGLWQMTYDNGWPAQWNEHLPGKGFLGVDAIYHTPSGGSATEYVLGASNKGVWYKAAPITTAGWDRPNLDLYYPDAWNFARVHDAAFYHDGTSYSNDPQDKFFVILAKGGVPPSDYNPGLYRWDETQQPLVFARVDEPYYYSTLHEYGHFYRDKGDPNILWVTSPHGIYKLYGSYASPKFEKLSANTKLDDLPIARPPADLPPLPGEAAVRIDR